MFNQLAAIQAVRLPSGLKILRQIGKDVVDVGINIARKKFVEPQSKSTDIFLGYVKWSFRGISDCSVGSSHTWNITILECSIIPSQSHRVF